MLRNKVKLIDVICSFPFFHILIFVLLSAAPFFWGSAGFTHRYIGADDYLAPINNLTSFHYSIYPFDHLVGAGYEQPFLVAMFPVYAFYYVTSWLGFTQLFSTILLISLQICVAQLAFFYSLKYFLINKFQLSNNYLAACIFGAITYGFSPYVIAEIIPGHGMTLFGYVLFPLAIRYLDALLITDKLNYAVAIALFVILAFCSPSFANVGNLYVFFIATAIYALWVTLAEELKLWRVSLRFSFFVALAFLSNLWWLLPHIYNLASYISVSGTQGFEMNNLVAYASKCASVVNVFQGEPECLMRMTDVVSNDYFVNIFHQVIFLLITLLVIYAAFNRQRHVYIMLYASLCSLLFLKGVQEPFAHVFLWAYDNVPGFQVMRRPTSKFYGFFLYFFLATATFGLAIATNKLAKNKGLKSFLIGLGCLAAIYMVGIFALTPSLKAFNIPPRYFEARDYLMQDHVERVLILPVVTGARPHYKPDMNSYTGIDFVDELFRFPKINIASRDLAINDKYFRTTSELIQLLRDNKSICEASRALGISHIVVRDDLERFQVEDAPKQISALLDKHRNIIQKKNFTDQSGEQLISYKLKPECSSSLINLNGDFEAFDYELLNPGKIALNIEGLRGAAKLSFLYEYSHNWKIFVEQTVGATKKSEVTPRSSVAAAYNAPSAVKLSLDEVGYLLRKPSFENSHEISQYANEWTIEEALLEDKNGDLKGASNSNGPVNVRLILYYQPQAYLLIGIMVSLMALLVLLLQQVRGVKLKRKRAILLGT